MKHNTHLKVAAAGLGLALTTSAHAAIVVVGSNTGYASTDGNWRSNTINDIDSNGLGTDGFIFFGDFDGNFEGNNNPGQDGNGNIIGAQAGTQLDNAGDSLFTVSAPSYITTASTIATVSTNVGQFSNYDPIDSPLVANGTDAVPGNLLVTGAGSAIEFTIGQLAPGTTVRVGILAGILNDDGRARFDTPEISLTNGTNTVSVTGLPNLSDGTTPADQPRLGFVFFDIDAAGTYGIAIPPDVGAVNPDVTGIGGITFDSISVPEPSTSLLAGLAGLSLAFRRRR